MKTVTAYEANDGKKFNTKEQCEEYEDQCADIAAANDMLINGSTLMAALTRAYKTAPWWDSGIALDDKVRLMRITKDTGFVLPHWQCSELIRYKPVRLNHVGQVFLSSSAYGGWVTLVDLIRYARETEGFEQRQQMTAK